MVSDVLRHVPPPTSSSSSVHVFFVPRNSLLHHGAMSSTPVDDGDGNSNGVGDGDGQDRHDVMHQVVSVI